MENILNFLNVIAWPVAILCGALVPIRIYSYISFYNSYKPLAYLMEKKPMPKFNICLHFCLAFAAVTWLVIN